MEIISQSQEETEAFGCRFGRDLRPNQVVCFFGDLAAGKTTFIRGLARGCESDAVISSPTFVYLNIYEGPLPIYHFDLYRLRDAEEFLNMGFDEFLKADGICCIEWSERIAALLPKDSLRVEIAHVSDNVRKIRIT